VCARARARVSVVCVCLHVCRWLDVCLVLRVCWTYEHAHAHTHTQHTTHKTMHTRSLQFNLVVERQLVWHDLFICVTWLIHMCDIMHSRVWYDSLTCNWTWSLNGSWYWRKKSAAMLSATSPALMDMKEAFHIYEWAMSHILTSRATYLNELFHIFGWVMSQLQASRVMLDLSQTQGYVCIYIYVYMYIHTHSQKDSYLYTRICIYL